MMASSGTALGRTALDGMASSRTAVGGTALGGMVLASIAWTGWH